MVPTHRLQLSRRSLRNDKRRVTKILAIAESSWKESELEGEGYRVANEA